MKTLIKRRDFLVGLSGITVFNLFTFSLGRSPIHSKLYRKMESYDMQLRPHHILDIVTNYGNGLAFLPSAYGHSEHIVAPKLLSSLDLKVMLVLGADDICVGCKHLLPFGNILNWLTEKCLELKRSVHIPRPVRRSG